MASFVPDTNVLVSHACFPGSVPASAFHHAILHARMIASAETLAELEDVLFRSKFDFYLRLETRLSFIHYLRRAAKLIDSVAPLSICRDPKDDKFLALAITGRADFILTGDHDLLSLHPFRGIDIVSPRQYLDRQHV